MRNRMDELLRAALAPTEVPSDRLNDRILHKAKENRQMSEKRSYRRSIPAAVIAAACILVLGSGTVLAAYHYLSPAEVAAEGEDSALEKAFLSDGAIYVNETQESGGYKVTLLGSVAGRNISDFIGEENGVPEDDRMYTVVAIERADGSPMPETSSDAYGDMAFYASHYIRGLDPNRYSIMSMGGGYSDHVRDGILYRLLEMDNLEMFADRGIYVGVCTGTFYDAEAYHYAESTGEMSRNENYGGVNALFQLPVDKSKADPEAAAKYLEEFERMMDGSAESEEPIEKDATDLAVEDFMQLLTPENIDEYAEPIESTRQTCRIEDGMAVASYDLGDDGAGEVFGWVETLFPDGEPGMSESFSYSYSVGGDGRVDLQIETYTLNEDGSVTFVLYRPKQEIKE